MIKSLSRRSYWLAAIILLTISALLIGGGCTVNELPSISNLEIDAEGEMNPGATADIRCTAVDPDEDELIYTWSADGGTLSGSGYHVTWTAPTTLGTYTISVQVSDGDDIVNDSVTVSVLAPNNPPVIESITTNCPRVKPAKNGIITVVASDPDNDELIYTWTTDRGSISGSGAEVTWTAPGEYGTYAVIVIVSDGRGGEATDGLNVIVCSCSNACG
ncbi:MAG: Ig-like domain-containing protein [Dehalococcoidia bacterium]|jgi:hypothetical protein